MDVVSQGGSAAVTIFRAFDGFDQVSQTLREVAEAVVLPRFRRLQAHELEEKSPGDLVTIADREAEIAIDQRLRQLLPGSKVVGEEATFSNPALLNVLDTGWTWLVDPVDGTGNFAAGRKDYAMLIALLRDGLAVAGWIFAPSLGRLFVAELGSGAWCEGLRITLDSAPFVRAGEEIQQRGAGQPAPGTPAALPGVLRTRYLPPDFRNALEPLPAVLANAEGGTGSAGIDYVSLLRGRWRYALYWRTLAWDHAPGCLLVTEAGGHVGRLDGSPYLAGDPRPGLLVASDPDAWQHVRAALPPESGVAART